MLTGQIFMCEFSDEARTKVFSARVRRSSANSHSYNIWCPIPEHIRWVGAWLTQPIKAAQPLVL
jgi:hypothetical protein